MSAAAGRQVKVDNIDESQLFCLFRRQLAQFELTRLFQRDKTNVDRPILGDDFVCQLLRLRHLNGAQGLDRQVDGAGFNSHVKTDCWSIEQANECRRKHVLAGVLLHVVAATRGIDQTNNALAFFQLLRNNMKDLAVFFFGYFCYWHFPVVGQDKFAGIENLPAASRIKRGAVKDYDSFPVSLSALKHICVEAIKKGIVIVEALRPEVTNMVE